MTKSILHKVLQKVVRWTLGMAFLGCGLSHAIAADAYPADRTISGTVSDASTGEALIGASIAVRGTNLGTLSDAQGRFQLSVPDNAETLVVSYLGYSSVSISLAGQSVFDIKMTLSNTTLDEIVVVGYGTQRKSDVTGAVGSLSPEDFNAGVIISPEQLIQGKLAGVSITGNNGEPGAAQTIIIRGPGSLRTGNTPLFVVDGVPLDDDNISPGRASVGFGSAEPLNPLNFINPADIQSIDVLKDASATAIYGSRGANGVILITTKKGTGKGGLNYSNYFGVSQVTNLVDVLSTEEFISYQETKGKPANIFNRNISTNWQEEVFRTAYTQNHSLGLSGGSDNSTYYVSMSLLDQEGTIPETDMQRYTGRVNFSQRLLDDRLKISVNLTAGHTDNSSGARSDNPGANTSGLIPDLLNANPTYPVYKNGDTLFVFPNGRNPLTDISLVTNLTRTDRVLGNIEGSFEIVSGLTYKLNFAVDRSVGNGEAQIRPTGVLSNIDFPEGRGVFSKTEANNRLIENYLEYKKAIDQHSFTFLAGHSYQYFFNKANFFSINGFATPEIDLLDNPGNGTTLTIGANRPGGNANSNKLQSFFGRVNYDFAGKYLLTATLRADGSSRFGEDNRYGTFPSVAAAWKLTEEDFLKGVKLITDLKVRVGWGQTGNQEIPGKITQASLSSNNSSTSAGYPLGTGPITPGIIFVRNANPGIKWEVTTQANLGLDFAILDGKIYGSVDLFDKKTTDVLLELTVTDPVSPTGTQWSNVDMDIINRGIELALNFASDKRRDFTYGIGGNATFLDNKVENTPFSFLRTGAINGPGLSGVSVAGNLEGEPIGTFYLREHLGFNDKGENIFRDINNDGVISALDRVVAGSPIPTFSYNFYGNVGYKGFDLSFNFNGVNGNKIYNNTANAWFNAPRLNAGSNIAKAYFNDKESTTNSATESTRYLEDGDFIRLNNATLRYRFNVSGIKWVKGLGVFVTGQNLLLITDYSGYDPEVNVPSSVGGIVGYGIDYSNYPRPRTFLGGIDLSF